MSAIDPTSFRWRLFVPQFSLQILLGWAALVSLVAIALANASLVWAQLSLTAVVLAGATTLLIAIYSQGAERARSLGRLVFGGLFFLWAVAHVDRWLQSNSYAEPRFGAVTGTLNELAYEGICVLRRMGRGGGVATPMYAPAPLGYSPPATYYAPTVSYRLLNASPDAGSESIMSPPNEDELVQEVPQQPARSQVNPYAPPPSTVYSSSGWTPVPALPTPIPIQPAISLLPFHEFHTIANCCWTLVCGALGGWVATVIYRQRWPATVPV